MTYPANQLKTKSAQNSSQSVSADLAAGRDLGASCFAAVRADAGARVGATRAAGRLGDAAFATALLAT